MDVIANLHWLTPQSLNYTSAEVLNSVKGLTLAWVADMSNPSICGVLDTVESLGPFNPAHSFFENVRGIVR